MASAAPPNPDPPPGEAPAFIPLEANPELMTTLLRKLGLSAGLQMHDVYSLTDADLLSFIPRPALALLLVFPVSASYESHRLAEDSLLEDHKGEGGDKEPVMWFKQTIRNACGLMGLLHAVANGPAKDHIEKGSDLDTLLSKASTLSPPDRARLLEQSSALANAHRDAASQGDTSAPQAEDDIDLHYVCFVKTGPSSSADAAAPAAGAGGTLWELDGRRKGPLARGTLEDSEDVLSQKALSLGPLKFLEREGADLRFSAVTLAPAMD